MQYCHRAIASLTVPVGLSVVLAWASPASAQQRYEHVNLVSDIAGVAQRTDPNLVNPWGVAFSSTGTFWVSDNGTGVATLYDGDGKPQPQPPDNPLVVTIPPPSGSPPGTKATPATPTGQVFNNSSSFVIPATGLPSVFLFATEDGTISGWNDVNRTNAILLIDNSEKGAKKGAVYKGLAIGTNSSGTFLYATNFHDGVIEQYDSTFKLVRSFTDPQLTCELKPHVACFAPFGIQNINGRLYVTYAKQKLPDRHDDEAGPGNGFVDIFDTDGNLVKRLVSGGYLNSPWGLALAPQSFGQFNKAFLLIGNFGDGHITAFDPSSGNSLGQLYDQFGLLTINGLWALVFGNGQGAADSNSLFFTAGIGDEGHGLFGVIRAREDQNKNDEHQDEYGESPDVMNY